MTGRTGAKKLLPEAWRRFPLFDNIHQLTGVPVITVQLRYPGWVTELRDPSKIRNLADVRLPSSSFLLPPLSVSSSFVIFPVSSSIVSLYSLPLPGEAKRLSCTCVGCVGVGRWEEICMEASRERDLHCERSTWRCKEERPVL
jgi:hypothetical protein